MMLIIVMEIMVSFTSHAWSCNRSLKFQRFLFFISILNWIRKINENERVNALKHIIRIQPYNIYGMRR